jgi:hypothetical protein
LRVSIDFLLTYISGYEKLFASLEKSIKWDVPAYGMLTSERREETIMKMTSARLYMDSNFPPLLVTPPILPLR